MPATLGDYWIEVEMPIATGANNQRWRYSAAAIDGLCVVAR